MLEGVAMRLRRDPRRQPVVTLLLASSADAASLNLHDAVLRLGGWEEASDLGHGVLRVHGTCPVHLLLIEELHINADGIDRTHEEAAGCGVDEVLVLSRHVSATKIPALTLHAIGLPGEVPHDEKGQAGGTKGSVVPPSPRFASLFRSMLTLARSRGLDEEFDLTLETTHHGPLLVRPALYIEIGSTEAEWSSVPAAELWAEVISDNLGLSGDEPVQWTPGGEVMIGLGGGHYAPRHKAVLSESDLWVGHLLANYALPFEEPIDGEAPGGAWRHSIQVSVESTLSAFPGANLFAHLDKKSFKGWQRRAILDLLSDLDVPVRRGRELNRASQL
jgi:D-aminoacyl-tRNA deacylase